VKDINFQTNIELREKKRLSGEVVIQDQEGSRVELQKASEEDGPFALINIQDKAKDVSTGSGQIAPLNLNAIAM